MLITYLLPVMTLPTSLLLVTLTIVVAGIAADRIFGLIGSVTDIVVTRMTVIVPGVAVVSMFDSWVTLV